MPERKGIIGFGVLDGTLLRGRSHQPTRPMRYGSRRGSSSPAKRVGERSVMLTVGREWDSLIEENAEEICASIYDESRGKTLEGDRECLELARQSVLDEVLGWLELQEENLNQGFSETFVDAATETGKKLRRRGLKVRPVRPGEW